MKTRYVVLTNNDNGFASQAAAEAAVSHHPEWKKPTICAILVQDPERERLINSEMLGLLEAAMRQGEVQERKRLIKLLGLELPR